MLSYLVSIGTVDERLAASAMRSQPGQPTGRATSTPAGCDGARWLAGLVVGQPLVPRANVAMGIRLIKDLTIDSVLAAPDRLEAASVQADVDQAQ